MNDNSEVKRDELDDEISALYAQRKETIVAPKINLSSANLLSEPLKKKTSLVQGISILLGASFASFGIFAIITHLSTMPIVEDAPFSGSQIVVIATAQISSPDTEVIRVVPPMPPQPEKVSIAQVTIEEVPSPEAPNIIPIEPPSISQVTKVKLPEVSLPHDQLLPTYKVTPSYPKGARRDKITGTVTLNYDVDASGRVFNIKLINYPQKDAKKVLPHSAIKALKQWQFAEFGEEKLGNQVVFEFRLEQG